MASELFDPLLDLAISVAKRGKKAKPPVAPPPRMVPMLSFAKLPDKAKDSVLDILDTDVEFRARVAKAASEKSVGRIGMSYLERPNGWEMFVAQMVDAAAEPIIESTSTIRKLQNQIEVAERARDRAVNDLEAARHETAELQKADLAKQEALTELVERLELLEQQNVDLVEQRQRAVSELKRIEEIMARHIADKKQLEALLGTMTEAQLSSTSVGGGVTDVEVRSAVDSIEASLTSVNAQLEALRSAATPERIEVQRRTPLPVPAGLFDDSVEYAEYLFAIPSMTVIIDGYNVTRTDHDDWDLEQQRMWLEQVLVGLCARTNATFDVVFDGADVHAPSSGQRGSGVRIRFSPSGVEADDVVIETVQAIDRNRPVTVVSSDNRVRDGSAANGANVLHSRQLIALL